MTAFLLVARLVLAGVFGGTGVAKLADRAGSSQALVDFGLPSSLANPLTILLPLAALAAFLVWQGWEGNIGPSAVAWIGALSTAQLLGILGAVLVLVLLAAQWWFLLHLMRQNGRLLVR